MRDRGVAPARSALVGRDVELERLAGALDGVLGGEGCLVLLSGEPGIGKTRLVEELAALAVDEGAVVAWGRVDDAEGVPPYWPWLELLRSVVDHLDEQALAAALGPEAGPIATILPEVKEWVADVGPLPSIDPAAARFRLSAAVSDFLSRAGASRPLVLVLDDLHWADAASLELTRFVASRLTTAPVLMVVTYRSVDRGASEGFDDVLAVLARQPRLERIALEGLSEQEVGRFMAQTIGMRSRPAAVASVHVRTEGNPFFAGELARLLHSEGLLGAAAVKGQEAPVPVGVRDVVRRRLGRLPKVTVALLELGAVVGREFDLAVVAASADWGGDIAEVVDAALAAQVVNEVPGVVGRFRFSHALVRDTVYGALSALRRATLHARVGAALQERYGAEPSRLAELASHFFHAAPVVGPEPGLTYAVDAAAAAQAALAYEQAEEGLRSALRLVELLAAASDRAERELHIQNRLAGLLLMTRGQGAAEFGQACARARELCQVIGEDDELFKSLFALSLFHVTRGEYRLLSELGGQLLAVGEQRTSTEWLLAGHFCVGSSQLHSGGLVAAGETFAAAERLARSLELQNPLIEMFGVHPLPIFLIICGLVDWFLGDEARALALIHEAVDFARSVGHPLTLADALYSRNKMTVLREDADLTVSDADEALKLCDEHGFGMFQACLRTHRGWALCRQGRCEEGVREMTAGLAVNRAGGGQMNTAFFLGLLADGEALRGEGDRALDLVEEALAVTRNTEEKLYESDLHRRRGELLAARGPEHRQAAIEALRTAIAVAEAHGAVPFRRRAEAALAALAVPHGAPRPADSSPSGAGADRSMLSPRECELLSLLGQGLTDKEIARQLLISLTTVRSHLDRIRDKTGRRRRPELTRLAVELGVIAG